MRIIHCADLHLDSNLQMNFTKEQARERNMELFATFEQMVQYGEREHVQAILLVGDLFDTSTPSSAMANAVLEVIASHPSIYFFYVRGNHDRHFSWREAEKLPENLKVFDHNWKTFSLGNLAVSGIECEGDSLFFQAGQLELPADKINLVLLHGKVVSKEENTGEDLVPLPLLRGKGIDYLALGHLHSYQKELLEGKSSYCYSGCLEGRGYDECGQKGFVLLEIKEDVREIHTEFITFGKRRIFEVPVSVSECMTSAQMARKIEQRLAEENVCDRDMVKVILRGAVDVACEKNHIFLQRRFAERFFGFRLEDATTLSVDYSEFLVDETLKGEFVRMIQEVELPEQDKVEIIRYGILALAGEELEE